MIDIRGKERGGEGNGGRGKGERYISTKNQEPAETTREGRWVFGIRRGHYGLQYRPAMGFVPMYHQHQRSGQSFTGFKINSVLNHFGRRRITNHNNILKHLSAVTNTQNAFTQPNIPQSNISSV